MLNKNLYLSIGLTPVEICYAYPLVAAISDFLSQMFIYEEKKNQKENQTKYGNISTSEDV